MHCAERRAAMANGCEKTGSSPAPYSLQIRVVGWIPKSRIRNKGSERHAGRADCPEKGAKRTSVRERRLKGKMPPSMGRSVRSPHTKKRRSLERRNKGWSGHKGLMDTLRAPLPLRLKPSGEFLKTAHRAVFLTEFHLIGSNPHNLTRKQNRSGNRLTCSIRW